MAALPWFAFDREAYLRNTMHLTTEEHGAYLLLMLAYYGTEKPLPGYDRALASITKLPLDRWGVVKVGLQPLFVVEGDVWRHERIDAELLQASSKHAAAVAKAKLAAEARYGKPSSEPAPSMPVAKPKKEKPPKPAPSVPEASPPPTPSMLQAEPDDAHLHLHLQSLERVDAPEGAKNSLSEAQGELGKVKEPIPGNPLGLALDPAWVPDAAGIEFARGQGMVPDTVIEAELLKFHDHNLQGGTFSNSWASTWRIWCKRFKEHSDRQPKAAKPRIDVNASAPFVPSPEQWDDVAKTYATTGQWPGRGYGNQPGPSCRCPPEILRAHGINPISGRPMETAT